MQYPSDGVPNDGKACDRDIPIVVDSRGANDLIDPEASFRQRHLVLDGVRSSSHQRLDRAVDLASERRQLTVMVCDLVNSTALATRLDPEDLREVIGTCLRCITNVVKRFGGTFSQFTGDGALAYFGYPTAHEDDAERAILAGLEIVGALSQLRMSEGCKPRIRIGIASGVVVVGETERTPNQDVVGAAPNLAARLQAIAGPDQVVIAPTTHKLAGALFNCRDLGPVVLKGFEEPVRAWSILGRRVIETPFDARHETSISTLVGREEEMAILLRRWQQVQVGDGRAVLIEGDAGIGKSRIRRALQEKLANQELLTMSFYCSPQHSNSPYYPIIIRLEQWAKFAHSDSAEQKFAKLEALFRQSTSDPEAVAFVAEILSLPAAQRPVHPS